MSNHHGLEKITIYFFETENDIMLTNLIGIYIMKLIINVEIVEASE